MKSQDTKRACHLVDALNELPVVRKRLRAKPGKFHHAVHLEIQVAEMVDGVSQGSQAYFNIPPELAPAILDAAEKVIRAELKYLGVTLPSTDREDGT